VTDEVGIGVDHRLDIADGHIRQTRHRKFQGSGVRGQESGGQNLHSIPDP
jgi:hypothetical protein